MLDAEGPWLLRQANRHSALLAFALALIAWESSTRLLSIPVFVLPAPSTIVAAGFELGVVRWAEHLFATLTVALLGFLAAIAVALPLAIGITGSPLLARTLLPWLIVVQSTPIVAIAPIIVVALGAGLLPRVVITTLIAFFPLVISGATGLAAAPPELLELSRSLRAPRHREYTQIRLPTSIPFLFAGLKVAITLSIIGAVVAEFVAAERGLGYLILFATSSFKVPLAFAALALLVASSLLLYALLVWIHRRYFPWSL